MSDDQIDPPDGLSASGALDQLAPGAGVAAQAGINLANRAIREAARAAASANSPTLKLHPTKPGCCVCGQRLNMHSQTYCVPDGDEHRVEDAVQGGEHASKGAARRAFGMAPIGADWFNRIAAGLAKTHPPLPNAVPTERQVVMFDKDGKVVYRSSRCRITPNKDNTFTIQSLDDE